MDRKKIIAQKRFNDFQNNTNISLQNKYIYFAVDKVANSTIKQSLFEIEYKPIRRSPVTLFDKRCSPLLSPYQLPEKLLREVLESGEYFRFAFVRNPYSRLLSCYLDRILTQTSRPRREFNKVLKANGFPTNEASFENFIRLTCAQSPRGQNSHWRSQYHDICYELVDFDYIAKFENLWPEMEVISQRIFGEILPEMKDRGVNKSPKVTGANARLVEFYTQELSDLVYETYQNDFETFDYDHLKV